MDVIDREWRKMQGDKSSLLMRCEKYSRWTLRGVCPPENTEDDARVPSYVVIGPRLVNSLSNKVVDTMFPHTRPFFSVNLSSDMKQKVREEAGDEALAELSDTARTESRWVEEFSMAKLNLVQYRPIAVMAAQHLIVTGNALIRRMPNTDNRVLYGIRDYGVRRRIDGTAYKVIIRDWIMPDELSDEDLAKVRSEKPGILEPNEAVLAAQHSKDAGLELLTRWERTKQERWIQTQEVNGVAIGKPMSFTNRDVPFIDLTWSLSKGDNYARGLVEEHENVFHILDVDGEAVFDIFQIMADIQFLVRPGSLVDVIRMNQAKRGTYHVGDPEDITTVELQKAKDLQILAAAVDKLERELSFVFLLGSTTIRDAERVTAREVEFNALELESAFGGLYSRLALQWQQKEAEYLVGKLKIKNIGKDQMFDITVTTGLETLSREGMLQQVREAIADLSLLNGVPEDLRVAINPRKIAAFLFGARGVHFEEFLYTQAEIAANAQQQQQADAQKQAMATEGAIAEKVMTE